MDNRPIVTGMFNDRNAADRAYTSLRERGYTDEEIHVMMSKETRERLDDSDADGLKIEHGSKAAEGAGTGAAIGGTVGGILGAIAAVGVSVAIPGLGLVIAGPLAGALAGAGAGGAAGTLLGGLVGLGIPEERAELYERGINEGGIVVGAHPRNEEDRAYFAEEFNNYGARDVYGRKAYADESYV